MLNESGFVQNASISAVDRQISGYNRMSQDAKLKGNVQQFQRWKALVDEYVTKKQAILDSVE